MGVRTSRKCQPSVSCQPRVSHRWLTVSPSYSNENGKCQPCQPFFTNSLGRYQGLTRLTLRDFVIITGKTPSAVVADTWLTRLTLFQLRAPP